MVRKPINPPPKPLLVDDDDDDLDETLDVVLDVETGLDEEELESKGGTQEPDVFKEEDTADDD
ncbi:MAG: hypothetical protein ACE5FF_15300 [Saprospiraceae bacterium]